MIWKKLSIVVLFCCAFIAVQNSHAFGAEKQLSIGSFNSYANFELLGTELSDKDRSKSSQTHRVSHRCTQNREHLRICANKRRIRLGLGKQDISAIDWHMGLASIQAALEDGTPTDSKNAIFGKHLTLYRSMRIRI